MSTSFDRLATQTLCESLVGCNDLEKWSNYRRTFENLELDIEQVKLLKSALLGDAKELYFKGLLSLSEAIHSMSRRLYSWAIIKAYYSVFYLLRSSLALMDYAIVRNGGLYVLPIEVGRKPEKKSANSGGYRNDHIGVITVFKELYSNSDKLQSNTIDGQNPYEWLMDRRHQINYRQKQFLDPNPPDFLAGISESVLSNRFDSLITSYVADIRFLYCFQSDHACLALPIKRLLMTKEDFANRKQPLTFSRAKTDLVRGLLVSGSRPLEISEDLIPHVYEEDTP